MASSRQVEKLGLRVDRPVDRPPVEHLTSYGAGRECTASTARRLINPRSGGGAEPRDSPRSGAHAYQAVSSANHGRQALDMLLISRDADFSESLAHPLLSGCRAVR